MAGIAIRQPLAHGWIGRRRAPAITPLLSQRVILWVGASLILVAAALNFYLFQVSIVATSAYDMQRLQQERQDWLARNQQLELELAKARSLAWVQFKATQDLHMVQGGEPVYLQLAARPSQPTPPAAAAEISSDSEGAPEQAPEDVTPKTPASRSNPVPFPRAVITILLNALRG